MRKRNRQSIRKRGYDYTRPGKYFVTICTKNREELFGEIVRGKMIPNRFGRIVKFVWNALPKHYPNVRLDAFVVMPDHIHGIIELIASESRTGAGFKPAPVPEDATAPLPEDATVQRRHGLPEIVRALKTFSARRINEIRNTPGVSVWQRNYWDEIIRGEGALLSIRRYIRHNPNNH